MNANHAQDFDGEDDRAYKVLDERPQEEFPPDIEDEWAADEEAGEWLRGPTVQSGSEPKRPSEGNGGNDQSNQTTDGRNEEDRENGHDGHEAEHDGVFWRRLS